MYFRGFIMLPLAFGMPGPTEMIIILVIVLVLFGAKKIPEFARSLGKATKEFKQAKSAFNDAVHTPPEQQIENQHNVAPPADEEDMEVDEKTDTAKEDAPKAEAPKTEVPKEEAKADSAEKK